MSSGLNPEGEIDMKKRHCTIKGTIQLTERAGSYTDLLEIDPKKYFGVPPFKWETGWNSADAGDMAPDQYFSWAEFAFKDFIPAKVIRLPLDYPDNEWAIYDVEVTPTGQDLLEILRDRGTGDAPALIDSDKILGEIFLEETRITEKVNIERNNEILWSHELGIPLVDGGIDTSGCLFIK